MQYRFDGKQKTYAIGAYPSVSLSEARTKRDEARVMIAAGCPLKKQAVKAQESGYFRF